MAKEKIQVAIILGSDSDYEAIQSALETLTEFKIAYELRVLSAHRSPDAVRDYALEASKRGISVIIAAAGGAAHLAGVLASYTTIPVIGVPIASSPLAGWDALLSTVQMPAGVPVATMAIGSAGAKNAALFAVSILALQDQILKDALLLYRKKLAENIAQKDLEIQKKK